MKRFFRIAALCMAAVLCGGCAGVCGETASPGTEGSGGPWQYVDTAMGTVVSQTIYAGEEAQAQAFSGEAMELLRELERERISWRLETSEVYRANRSAGSGEGFPLSQELSDILEDCRRLWERSEGAFDVTLGSVARLWRIDEWAGETGPEGFQIPSGEALEEALGACGSDRMRVEGNLLFLPDGMQLDLGAVGKGLAMEELCALLESSHSVTGAVISLGGGILTYGRKPDGSAWKVGITDPFDKASYIGVLTLEGQWCVSTSGDYERYVEVDGVRYHHILDPKTGFPAAGQVRSATILSRDGLLSDGLSTACFLLGPEKGTALAAEYGAEALFVLADGEIVMSEGMEKYFRAK